MKALGMLTLLLTSCGMATACGAALTPAEQAKLDNCTAQFDELDASCAARKAVCREPGCEDEIEAECAAKAKEICP